MVILTVPERLECARENLRKMFGVVWAVDTTRADIAEGDFRTRIDTCCDQSPGLNGSGSGLTQAY